jgi:D-amino-acid dehydrogenase
MVPDGKPIIGRLPKFDNAWVAAGHGMLGLSMATGTGKLVSELIGGATPHVDPAPYRVERFS